MKKKILILTLIGTIISVIIYFYTKSDEITIVALGDGLSLGMTPYEIEGMSFNDYLKEDYKEKYKLKKYNPLLTLLFSFLYLIHFYLHSIILIPIFLLFRKKNILFIKEYLRKKIMH